MSHDQDIGWWATTLPNPFRLFFPLGIVFGVMGVGIWVLWSVGVAIPAAALMHATLQTQGFLSSFAVGFLMTAFPRFTGTRNAAPWELAVGLVAAAAVMASALAQSWMIEQAFFLVLMLNLFVFAARRLRGRTKPLPPTFLLMGFGLLQSVVGPVLIISTRFGVENYPLFAAGRQMIQLGFLLCAVLGISGKLAPFLMGYSDAPDAAAPKTPWTAFAINGLAGAAIMGSFFIDGTSPRGGAAIRAAVATAHLFAFARIGRPLRKKTTLMWLFYISLWMVPTGLCAAALWPALRIAALHIVFIGGFSLMIFSFGLLIVLSHSLKANLINTPLTSMKAVGGLVVSALVLRFCAELHPSGYLKLIHLASGLWVIAALTWLGAAARPMLARAAGDH